MRHLVHNGVDHVIWKETNNTIEAITPDGAIVSLSSADPGISLRYDRHLSIEPNSLPFDQRPRSFVEELQLRRVEYLRENQSKKRTDKGPRAKSAGKGTRGTGGARAKKPSKTSLLIQQMAAQKLAAAGITNPVALEAMRKLMGG